MHIAATLTLQAFLRSELRQAQHWQKALQQSSDPENVHQLRVCIRKIRTALRLSKPILKHRYRQRWQMRFRDAAKQLDKARDLDVLLLTISPDKALQKQLKKQQKKTYKTLRKNLHTAPFSQWQKLSRQLKQPVWIKQRCRKRKLGLKPFAAGQLEPLYQQIEQAHGRLYTLDEEALHRLRIQCKQLRYACEFVEAALSPHNMAPFLSALQGLQDSLGAVHDANVQQSLLADCPTVQQSEIAAVLSADGRKDIATELGDFLRLSKPWSSLRRK